jgi:hypothetical protein
MKTISSLILSLMFFVITDLVEVPLWLLANLTIALNGQVFNPLSSVLSILLIITFGFFSGLLVGKGYSGLLSKFYSDRLVILIPGVFILVLCTIVVHMAFHGQSSIGYIWLVEAANLSVDESYELAISCFSSWIAFSWAINPSITKSFLEWFVGGSKK